MKIQLHLKKSVLEKRERIAEEGDTFKQRPSKRVNILTATILFSVVSLADRLFN